VKISAMRIEEFSYVYYYSII